MASAEAEAKALAARNASKAKRTDVDLSKFGGGVIGADFKQGIAAGQGILGEEGLGTLGGDADIQEVLGRFKDISKKGLSSKEFSARRAQTTERIDANTQTALRGIQGRLARSGVRGGAAAQALLQVQATGTKEKNKLERDLFLESSALQREGLKDFSSRLGDVKQFDLAQQAKEKDILLQSALGAGKLGSADRAAKAQAAAAIAAARVQAAAQCFHPDTIINGKVVAQIEPGFHLGNGNYVEGVLKGIRTDNFYNYNDVIVTAEHLVFHNNEWVKVQDTNSPVVISTEKIIYSLITSKNYIMINDNLFADYEGYAGEDVEELIQRRMNEIVRSVPERKVQ